MSKLALICAMAGMATYGASQEMCCLLGLAARDGAGRRAAPATAGHAATPFELGCPPYTQQANCSTSLPFIFPCLTTSVISDHDTLWEYVLPARHPPPRCGREDNFLLSFEITVRLCVKPRRFPPRCRRRRGDVSSSSAVRHRKRDRPCIEGDEGGSRIPVMLEPMRLRVHQAGKFDTLKICFNINEGKHVQHFLHRTVLTCRTLLNCRKG